SIWESLAKAGPARATGKDRGVMDLMSRALDTMQSHMARLHLAQDPPDLLIRLPRDAATFYEFWRARELLERGRDAAEKALDAAGLGERRLAWPPRLRRRRRGVSRTRYARHAA